MSAADKNAANGAAALVDATQQQRNAANPAFTRMASANAGSGKTRVLVDRVSRILLQGVEPSDILCLTYTKAAAAEMQERLFEKLGGWSITSEEDLAQELEKLFGQKLETISPPINLKLARQLFAKALETPEGLKVQTIHAFCERILSRFPIEAGILPGFEPLDDGQMMVLRADVRRQILIEAAQDMDGDLAKAIAQLTVAKADQSLDELLSWMAGAGEKIRIWESEGGLKPLSDILGVTLGQTASDFAVRAWEQADKPQLESFLTAFSGSASKTDLQKAENLRAAMAATDAELAFEAYCNIFLTKESVLRSRFGTKKLSEDVLEDLTIEAQRIMATIELMRGAEVLELTQAVYIISLRYRQLYQEAKHAARGLDYNDQILFVRDLLSNLAVADWVRYKLDGGIEHILVDEAQDTSPDQWAIIDALAAPFFQPSPDDARITPRTLFAVGDEKQSIYSFQGAVPEMFLDKIRQYLPADGMGEVRMRMSFRSTQQVLDVVDHVLNEGGALQDMFDVNSFPPSSDIIRHPAWRADAGAVELWPIVLRPEKQDDREAWDTRPVDALGESNQREILAKEIAGQIRGWIDDAKPVFIRDKNHPDGGELRPIHAGHILILVRRRGSFFEAIIRQLKKHDIAVAGADRLTLQDSLIVKDMLALTRFVLLPRDDLSLAEVLKSPFFGLNDEQLFDVAVDREGSLWASLQSREPKIATALEDLIELSRTRMPYEFYAEFLDRKDAQGQSFRKRIYGRLSLEAQDALEAFLACALEHHLNNVPSLQRFLQSFESNDVQIKREMDGAAQEVRVMTAHGAKGLEAPIVILPDTTQTPTNRAALMRVDAGFAYKASKAKIPAVLKAYADMLENKQLQEQLRLLYVAMTRAESRLIICGFDNGQSKTGLKKGSWYDRISQSFETLETTQFETPFDVNDITGKRYGSLPNVTCVTKTDISETITAELPAWIHKDIDTDTAPPRRHVTASHLLAENLDSPAQRSPSRAKDQRKFLRGNVIHKLLEVLPEFPPERRGDIAQTLVRGYPDLQKGQAGVIIDEVFTVLEHPDFASIFAVG
ncbi:MAG: double-strand break repair helicase AddA, partial [Litorimonas sp.]